MTRVSIVEVKRSISAIVNRAAFGRERVILTSRGKPKAALVSIEDNTKVDFSLLKDKLNLTDGNLSARLGGDFREELDGCAHHRHAGHRQGVQGGQQGQKNDHDQDDDQQPHRLASPPVEEAGTVRGQLPPLVGQFAQIVAQRRRRLHEHLDLVSGQQRHARVAVGFGLGTDGRGFDRGETEDIPLGQADELGYPGLHGEPHHAVQQEVEAFGRQRLPQNYFTRFECAGPGVAQQGLSLRVGDFLEQGRAPQQVVRLHVLPELHLRDSDAQDAGFFSLVGHGRILPTPAGKDNGLVLESLLMRVFALVLLAALLLPSPTIAVKQVKLGSLIGRVDFKPLVPLLEKGEFSLVESYRSGRLRQVTVVALVKASPDKVWRVLTDSWKEVICGSGSGRDSTSFVRLGMVDSKFL